MRITTSTEDIPATKDRNRVMKPKDCRGAICFIAERQRYHLQFHIPQYSLICMLGHRRRPAGLDSASNERHQSNAFSGPRSQEAFRSILTIFG